METTMITHSDSIAKLAPALVKANAEVHHAVKDSKNPHFRSDYASLTSVLDTIKPVYAEHGLTVTQIPGLDDAGRATLDVMLLHESGEWLKGTSGAPLQKDDPQGVGSAITYLRRYSLAAMAGIGQEDDDGNAASAAPRAQKQHANGSTAATDDMIPCPECGSDMWDNRADKRSPKAPDLKCKANGDHAIWLKTWRDDLLKEVAEAHGVGVIDDEKRAKADEACASMSPVRLQGVRTWLDGLVLGSAAS